MANNYHKLVFLAKIISFRNCFSKSLKGTVHKFELNQSKYTCVMGWGSLSFFRIDRSSMIHNVRPSVRPYVRMSVRPSVRPYNLPNRNRYEKSVITKKLRIDKNRCNEKLFFKRTLFFGLEKSISQKARFF